MWTAALGFLNWSQDPSRVLEIMVIKSHKYLATCTLTCQKCMIEKFSEQHRPVISLIGYHIRSQLTITAKPVFEFAAESTIWRALDHPGVLETFWTLKDSGVFRNTLPGALSESALSTSLSGTRSYGKRGVQPAILRAVIYYYSLKMVAGILPVCQFDGYFEGLDRYH